MSWQAYVDDKLIGSGHITKAAIISVSDGSPLAQSGLSLKHREDAGIFELYKTPSEAYAKGITIDGVEYMCIRADNRSIYGKKDATGIVLVKTNQAILIGYYDETKQPGKAALAVEDLGDYLLDNGY